MRSVTKNEKTSKNNHEKNIQKKAWKADFKVIVEHSLLKKSGTTTERTFPEECGFLPLRTRSTGLELGSKGGVQWAEISAFREKTHWKKAFKKSKKVVDKHDLIKYSIQVARQKAEHKHEDLPCRLRKKHFQSYMRTRQKCNPEYIPYI